MSNFNLIIARHHCALEITAPGDLPEAAEETLAVAADLIRVPLNSSGESEIQWDADYGELTGLRCVYFERLSVDGCTLLVEGDSGAGLVQVNTAQQLDDKIYCELPSQGEYTDIRVTLTVPDVTDSNIVLTPPFFGGENTQEFLSRGYLNGREYGFTGASANSDTKSTRLPDLEPDFEHKRYSVRRVPNAESAQLRRFFKAARGQLVLHAEQPANEADHFLLGFVQPDSSVRERFNRETFNLTVNAKNAL